MFRIDKPSRPYIVLESLTEGRFNGEKILHLIAEHLPGETIKLGRGNSCEIRMTDVTVSRIHSHIQYEQGRFVLYDNHSKFGTLVKMRRGRAITQDSPFAIQVGRTVIAYKLKQEAPLLPHPILLLPTTGGAGSLQGGYWVGGKPGGSSNNPYILKRGK